MLVTWPWLETVAADARARRMERLLLPMFKDNRDTLPVFSHG
jgi:hypothetical protein